MNKIEKDYNFIDVSNIVKSYEFDFDESKLYSINNFDHSIFKLYDSNNKEIKNSFKNAGLYDLKLKLLDNKIKLSNNKKEVDIKVLINKKKLNTSNIKKIYNFIYD